MSRRWKSAYLPAGICILLTVLLLQNPKLAAEGFRDGLLLCINTVLPALFPFFVLCEILLSCPLQGRFLRLFARLLGFHHEKAGLALLLSWFGGYAVCAHLVEKLHQENNMDARESNLLLLLGCCSSPGFVIGSLGGFLFSNLRLGILLYGLQIAANLFSTALCFPLLPQSFSGAWKTGSGPQAPVSIPAAIQSAVTSSLGVCGCVIFFRITAAVLLPILPEGIWSVPLLSACLEISSGCAQFVSLGGLPALYGCCACMSLLGLSVWVQISSLLRGAASLRMLAVNRLIHLGCFLTMVWISSRFLPGTVTVYRTLKSRVITTNRIPMDAAVVVFVFVCTTLYKVQQNFYNK